MKEGMRIVKLTAENYKRLKAIEITPDSNTVVISGKNGAGKTSALDAIWAALSGGDAGKKIKQPVRKGEEKAKIELDLGDILVTRTWTSDDKTYLTVENKDGAKYPSPQSILDALVGRLTFDPLEFAGLKAKEQVAALLEVVKLDIDPAKIDEQRKEIFDARTDINRDVIRLEGMLKSSEVPAKDAPTVEISLTSVMLELDAAKELKRQRDSFKERLAQAVNHKDNLITRIEALREELVQETENIEKIKKDALKINVPDIDLLQRKLQSVEEGNVVARRTKAYRETEEGLKELTDMTQAYTDRLKEIDKQKSDAIKDAKMPVDGLSFDEEGLTFNGVPFAQASSAEQLRISTAMAMAANPKLKVIRITDGSLLDSDSMKIIEKLADDQDYQVWIEVVDDTGQVGIYIEDGEIKSEDGEVK